MLRNGPLPRAELFFGQAVSFEHFAFGYKPIRDRFDQCGLARSDPSVGIGRRQVCTRHNGSVRQVHSPRTIYFFKVHLSHPRLNHVVNLAQGS